MKRTLFVMILGLSLVGCSSPEERAAKKLQQAERIAAHNAKIERQQQEIELQAKLNREAAFKKELQEYNEICRAIGYKAGTVDMADCIKEERQNKKMALEAAELLQIAENERQRAARNAAADAFIGYADKFVADENRRINDFNSRQGSNLRTTCRTFGSTTTCR